MLKFSSTLVLGLIAAIIGSYLQHRSWKNRTIEELKRREFEETLEIMEKLESDIAKRTTASRHFLSLLNSKTATDDDFNAYQEIIFDWMNKFPTHKSKIFHYFGRDEMLEFEYGVHATLKEASDIILRTRKLGYSNLSIQHQQEHKKVSKILNFSQYVTSKFVNHLNEKISNEEIGKTKSLNNIHERDMNMISKTYLIQRLFGLKL